MRILDFLRRKLVKTKAAPIVVANYVEPSSCNSHACKENRASGKISYLHAVLDNPEISVRFGYFFLAEGLGSQGRSLKSLASIVMESITDSLLDASIEELAMRYIGQSDLECEGAIQTAFLKAHKVIKELSAGTGAVTITGAFIRAGTITVGCVGGNRLYWIDRNGIQTLTKEHVLIHMMPPHKTALYRALGQLGPQTIDVSTSKSLEDGYLLLCTWRLWESMSNERVWDEVMTSCTLEDTCHRILKKAWIPLDDRELALIVASYPKSTRKISLNSQALPR